MTTAEVFRKFSRSESLSAADRDAALLWLRRLRGFSKTETDAWLFVAECISGHAELFAKADDRQVLFLVEKRFKAYLKYPHDKEAERHKLFHVTALDVEQEESPQTRDPDEPPSGRRPAKKGVNAVNWKELQKPSKAELAQDARALKSDDFAQFLQRLKARRDKESSLYLTLIQKTLRENAKCSRKDLALEEALRLQAMARNPRIRSLTYKKSRPKK